MIGGLRDSGQLAPLGANVGPTVDALDQPSSRCLRPHETSQIGGCNLSSQIMVELLALPFGRGKWERSLPT
jgi:hypothetical protein